MTIQKKGPFLGIPQPPPVPFSDAPKALVSHVSNSESSRTRVIAGIQFGMMSGTEMMRLSHLSICSRELFRAPPSRAPAPYGVLDNRLGVSNKTDECGTCGKKLADCVGHWGNIALELPVFHIGFLKATQACLQAICKTCSRMLLPEDERRTFLRSMRDPKTDLIRRARIRKRIIDACKKVSICPHCSAYNGIVKKINASTCFRLVHERYRGLRGDVKTEMLTSFHSRYNTASESDPSFMSHVRARATEIITPLMALDLFRAIPDCDLDLLWHDRLLGRPESMIMTHVLVPPVAIRPSVAMDAGAGSNEDDLTMQLQRIVHINTALRIAISKGGSARIVQVNWDFLQVQVAGLINGDLPGFPPALKPKRSIRALAQRLKGKQGRFRGNLSGKRVDFSGRTVISPDPNLPLHAVGVPVLVAKIMTYPERVTETNFQRMKQAVINGPNYPGANTIRSPNGLVRSLAHVEDRQRIADQLCIGDIVERHMIDGDVVLFNRQPSLHKMSIMSHRAKVLPHRTFRFNECVCTPYNADFDGDEMNLHLPQTEEARTEAALLMDVRENLITSRSGEPLIAAHQDFLTAAWLLTQRDMFLTRDEVCQAMSYFSDATEHVDLPEPAIMKPGPFWTGKQVINALLKPNKSIKLNISFETGARNWSKKPGPAVMCPNDGYVVFRNGELMCGNLDKEIIGGGSKKGLVFVLIRDNDGRLAARVLHRITKMTSRWLTNYGFSIGVEDVSPSEKVQTKKLEALRKGYANTDELIAQYQKGTLPLQPGCNAEQSLEALMNGALSKLRDTMGSMCMAELDRLNPPRVMATCGSKGSTLNISQMVACVGQQSVGGSRIKEGFVNRTLPIFPSKAKEPAAKGFVANSFYSGLNATEFFFHTMGGREGLVDTAVKTAETGYMQRRMMKSLEDLSVQYDGTVRTSSSDIVQFAYGDDGLDPKYMEANGKPADFSRALLNATVSRREKPLTLEESLSIVNNPPASGAASSRRQWLQNAQTAPALDGSDSQQEENAVLPSETGLSPNEIRRLVDKAIFSDYAYSYLAATPAAAAFAAESGICIASLIAEEAKKAGKGLDKKDATFAISAKEQRLVGPGAAFAMLIRAFFYNEIAKVLEERCRHVYQHLHPENQTGTAMDVDAIQGNDAAWPIFDSAIALTNKGAAYWASSKDNLKKGSSPFLLTAKDITLADSSNTQAIQKCTAPITVPAYNPEQEIAAVLARTSVITRSQLAGAIDTVLRKYNRAAVQPGEAVGAVAAHSLGEPATQMTLKTFHFAGVASMNVTLGVPRIKEILNASRTISTPIIEAALENADSEVAARSAKARIERTTLGDIAEYIKEVYTSGGIALEIRLDLSAIDSLCLEGLDAKSVTQSILKVSSLRLKAEHIKVVGNDVIRVEIPRNRRSAARIRADRQRKRDLDKEKEQMSQMDQDDESPEALNDEDFLDPDMDDSMRTSNEQEEDEEEDYGLSHYTPSMKKKRHIHSDNDYVASVLTNGRDSLEYSRDDSYFALQSLKLALPTIIVAGIPTVSRAVITKGDTPAPDGSYKYKLLVEGYDLLAVMGTPGIKASASKCNHIIETEETLGIEAARLLIISELSRTYGSYGITVDPRHTQLLADVMTYRGTVLGITRFGIARMKDSVLMLASFEKTPDHLFDAAIHARTDTCRGVSESIIVGTPIPLGTGLFKVLTPPNDDMVKKWINAGVYYKNQQHKTIADAEAQEGESDAAAKYTAAGALSVTRIVEKALADRGILINSARTVSKATAATKKENLVLSMSVSKLNSSIPTTVDVLYERSSSEYKSGDFGSASSTLASSKYCPLLPSLPKSSIRVQQPIGMHRQR